MQQLSEREALLCINALNKIGAQKLQDLLGQYGSYAEIWKNYFSDVSDRPTITAICQELTANSINWITLLDPEYPVLLKEIPSPPIVLYYYGNINLLSTPCIGIVGTRRATAYSEQVIETFVPTLVTAGLTIVSGFQRGVDTLAHTQTLKCNGQTIAVLGAGLDIDYPPANKSLRKQMIATNNLIISEYPPGTLPFNQNFPRRNRIISGLSAGVIVTEAAKKSGSLITANFAIEQNREVFAIPGSVLSPLSEGPHYLIQQGAKLIQSPEQIFEELGITIAVNTSAPSRQINTLNSDQTKIVAALDVYGKHIDKLIEDTHIEPSKCLAELTVLELEGLVLHVGNGIYSKTRP